ncbi:MAG TPA: type II secretion system protein GspL [Rhodocyclaceae bacterium]|nr:type II secretion system protein GspL [Rhodocyclaceae bacterium]
MKTLRVLLSETWPEQSEARWALLGDNGKPESEGISDPRHWPTAQRIEAILLGAQVTWHNVRVPNANVREQARSIVFGLEEQLVREADSQHITPTLRGEETWSVLVIARERLRRLVAQFKAIKRPLDGVYCAGQTVPLPDGEWTFAVHGHEAWLRTGDHSGFADDLLDDAPPALLTAAIEHARAAGSLPHTLGLLGAGKLTVDLQSWGKILNMPVELGGVDNGTWHWYRLPGNAANLLHGEFAPRHHSDAWLKLVKPAVILAATVLIVNLVLNIGEVFVRRAQVASLRDEMTQLLRSQMPGTPALDPPLQLRRELNQQRSAHGQLADDDALSLLAELSAALGADATDALQSVRYEGGTLNVILAPGKTTPTGLVQRLAAHGIRAVQRDGDATHLALRRES